MAKVPETIYLRGGDIRGSEDEKRMAHSLWAMTKDGSDYKWKSPKQADFYLNFYRKYGEKHRGKPWEDHMDFMWTDKNNIPPGTEMIFYVELAIGGMGGVRFGKKSRRLGKIIFLNRNGVLRSDTVKFFYKDSGDMKGQSGIDSVQTGQPTGIDSSGLEPIVDKKPQWQVDKETIKASSQYIGQPGDKMQQDLTLMTVLGPYDSQWGEMFITLFKDDKNNQYVYFGQELGEWAPDHSSFERMTKGQKATVKFTVKKHTERDGTKQTVISRPKIVKKLSEEISMSNKRPIFEKYQALYESKQVEQIARSLGYLLSIASDAQSLQSGIEKAEPMLNKKLVKRLAATLHVISKIKSGDTPNEAPLTDEPDGKDEPEKEDKKKVDEAISPEQVKQFEHEIQWLKSKIAAGGLTRKQEAEYRRQIRHKELTIAFGQGKGKMQESHMGELADTIDNILATVNTSPEQAVEIVKQKLSQHPVYGQIPDLEDVVETYVMNKVSKARGL